MNSLQRLRRLWFPATGLLALLLFAWLAHEVSHHGPITRLDTWLAGWFNRHAFSPLTELMLGYTHLHGTIGVLAMGALLLWHLARQRRWDWALTLVVVLPGGMLFNFGLKHVFARLRPLVDDPILVLHSYSFPSGHTIGAALLYATLAAYLLERGWHGARAVAAACLLVALTALSRLYLGAHFLSDVIGAALLGLFWFALWSTVVLTTWRHYSSRSRSN